MPNLRLVAMLPMTVFAAFAQLAAPDPQGVAMGHIHVNAADPEVQKKFWTELVGATAYEKNGLSGVTVPGALVLIRKAVPAGASVGSTVDHIGFFVPDLRPYYARVDAAGLKHFKPGAPEQMMIEGPDGLRIELSEDKSATIPLRFHHIHFHNSDTKAMQVWYALHFGAVPGKRAEWDAGELPGANLTFAHADHAVATQGRALDHIGFEVKNLEAFCRKLTDAGIRLDTPYRTMPRLKIALAFLTDPWGTRIELTEGLGAGL